MSKMRIDGPIGNSYFAGDYKNGVFCEIEIKVDADVDMCSVCAAEFVLRTGRQYFNKAEKLNAIVTEVI